MPLDTSARRLTTASEQELLKSSRGKALGALSGSALRTRISRARRLRDKQRDLLKRQRLASRGRTGTKHGSRPATNERTERKAELFQQALARFQARLDDLESSAPEKRKPASRAGKSAPLGKRPRPGSRAERRSGKSPKAGQQALLQKARTPRMKAIQAHVSSRGRRTQARRDARR